MKYTNFKLGDLVRRPQGYRWCGGLEVGDVGKIVEVRRSSPYVSYRIEGCGKWIHSGNVQSLELVDADPSIQESRDAIEAIKSLLDTPTDVLSGNAISLEGGLYRDVYNGLRVALKLLGSFAEYKDLPYTETEKRDMADDVIANLNPSPAPATMAGHNKNLVAEALILEWVTLSEFMDSDAVVEARRVGLLK